MSHSPSQDTAAALDWAAVFHDRILPALAVTAGGHAEPRLIFVCGQPGCGKSTLLDRLGTELDPTRTQLFSSDALSQCLPELFADRDDPDLEPAIAAFRETVRRGFVDDLMERAMDLRAHILWEIPSPGNFIGVAAVARAIGYRVECLVFATPIHESWLATLERETRATDPTRVPRRASWANQKLNAPNWPIAVALAEELVAFDSLQIIGRDGVVYFENHSIAAEGGPYRWANPPFAFESLLVERLQPRNRTQITELQSRWNALRAHPEIAFRNHLSWPWDSIDELGRLLQSLLDDPATGFDLNIPATDQGPEAAAGWLARLQAQVAALLAAAEAKDRPALAARCDRLQALVRTLTGQSGA